MRKQRTRAGVGVDNDNEMDERSSENDPVPLVEQLDSLDVAEREEALQTIEQLAVLSPELIPQLVFQTKLADKLNSRVLDAKSHVRELAVSLLKTLCQAGHDNIVDYFVKQDVLTPLLDLFSKFFFFFFCSFSFSSFFVPRMKVTVVYVDDGVRSQVYGILGQVLGALHELCQRSEDATSLVASHPQVSSLLDYLDPAYPLPVELRCGAAHVLQDLVEDCPTISDALSSSARAQTLLRSGAQSEHLLLRSLCCGVLFELTSDCFACVTSLQPALTLQLPQALLQLRDSATAAALETGAREAQIAKQQDVAEKNVGDEEKVEMEQEAIVDLPHVPSLLAEGEAAKMFSRVLGQWQVAAQAQQQALETLANVFSSLTLSTCKNEREIFGLSMPHLSSVVALHLGSFEAQLGEQLIASLPALDGCVDKLQLLQLRALHCLNNAFIGVSSPELLYTWVASLWTTLLDQLREASDALSGAQSGDDELLDALATSLWSLARVSVARLPVSPAHASLIASVLSRRLSRAASVSLAGCLGSLAPVLRADANTLTHVTNTLQQCCNPSSSPLLLAETLNSLVDLFSDDDTHAVFVATKLADCLAAIPLLVRKASATAGLGEDDLERLMEVASNAQAFLEYKKSN
jgi:hypothetical protein